MAFRYAASAVSCVSLAGSRPGHCDATASTVSVPPAFGPVAFFGAVLPQALAINAIETTADSATKRFLLRIQLLLLLEARCLEGWSPKSSRIHDKDVGSEVARLIGVLWRPAGDEKSRPTSASAPRRHLRSSRRWTKPRIIAIAGRNITVVVSISIAISIMLLRLL